MWLAVDSGKAPEANACIVMPHIGVNGGGQRTWERGNEAGNREGRMISKHLKNSSFSPFWVKKKEALKLLFERYRLEAKMYCHRGSFPM